MRMDDKKAAKRMIWILVFLLALILSLTAWNLLSKKTEEETAERTYWTTAQKIASANSIEIVHDYIPLSSPRRPGEIREIRYIIIHETDNRSAGANAAAHSALLLGNTEDTTSWHYTVDDHSIYHHIPDNEISWNAGDNRTADGGNQNGIAIEMCVNIGNDYEKTLENTAALTAELMKAYDLTLDDVRLHQSFSGKICPHRLITEGRVKEFYQMIKDEYAALSVEETADTK